MEKTFGDFSLEGGLRFDLADYKYFHGGQLQEDVSRTVVPDRMRLDNTG